jgi:antitoxin VapB
MHTAKIFRNGKSQAVRLPKEFRLEGDEVYVNQVGGTVVLFPKENPWASFFESLSRFSDDFMTEREQPPAEQRDF